MLVESVEEMILHHLLTNFAFLKIRIHYSH